MAATWLEEILSAFYVLGGATSYDKLYSYIEANTSRKLTKAWKATVRREIENHSTDSDNYTGGADLFYPVHGIHSRSGTWGLKSVRSSATLPTSDQDASTTTKYNDQSDNIVSKTFSETQADYTPDITELLHVDDIDNILGEEEEKLDVIHAFDLNDITDARERIFAAIIRRRGQSKFRSSLLKAYNGKCAITGTDAREVLEAAHIVAYKGSPTNRISNGLLLRADIHTLFDLRLIAIDTATMTVLVSTRLQSTEYTGMIGKLLNLPVIASERPSKHALDIHRSESQL